MSTLPVCIGVIPARWASSRFEGKPLADILGRPMFWHVYQRALQCPLLGKIILATDDKRIYQKAEELKVPVVMTRDDHVSGSDRVLEAAEFLNTPEDAVVVNIQGDEPLLDCQVLSALAEPFADPQVQVTTPAVNISAEEAKNPDQVKVVVGKSGNALYFSRSLIPYPRGEQDASYWGHIGLYAFRMSALRTFTSLPPGALEKAERLEQLRLLENDIPIYVVPVTSRSIGVDRPEDIDKVIKYISENPS